MTHRQDARRNAAAACLALAALALAPTARSAERSVAAAGDVAAAEALVRAVWFEGIPLARARALGAAASARLAEMLSDPHEAAHNANIVLALGASGQAGAFDALTTWAARTARGEVDRHAFRALRSLPFAMGLLAAEEPRALAWLLERAGADAPAPGWSFRRKRGARLGTLLRRQALTALGLSGRPEARALLEEVAEAPDAKAAAAAAVDPALARHAASALALHAQVSARGLEEVLAAEEAGR
jgi:hypothetical protein